MLPHPAANFCLPAHRVSCRTDSASTVAAWARCLWINDVVLTLPQTTASADAGATRKSDRGSRMRLWNSNWTTTGIVSDDEARDRDELEGLVTSHRSGQPMAPARRVRELWRPCRVVLAVAALVLGFGTAQLATAFLQVPDEPS